MWNTFKYTVIYLARDRDILLWALLFPVILATLFSFMFGGIDGTVYARDIGLVVVEDEAWQLQESVVMREAINSMSEPGTAADEQGSLLRTTFVPDEQAARAALSADGVVAYLVMDAQGSPRLSMKLDPSDASITTQQTVLKTAIDNVRRMESAVAGGVEQRILADMASGEGLQALSQVDVLVERAVANLDAELTEQVSLTKNQPTESTRYYYALLGMAAMFGATISLVAMSRARANTSEVGARRALGATSQTRVLLATFAAAWLLSFLCLMVAFAYIRVVLGVSFGGRDVACVAALAMAALVACALGLLVGALPRIPEGGKNGIMTGIACLSALFAGLYGQACMTMADELAAMAPWTEVINPARQISQAFYSLYYYDSYEPFLSALGVLAAMSAVFLAGAALIARRQQHEHL